MGRFAGPAASGVYGFWVLRVEDSLNAANGGPR